MNFNVISGKVVDEALKANFNQACAAIKEAYVLHGKQKSVNPNSYFLKFPENPNARIIALPAFLGGEFDLSGIKWIGSYPENREKKIPRASAVLILNDSKTGYPFACMEASIISAMRTAISAVIAAEYLTHKSARNIGFVGNGLIAHYIAKVFKRRGWGFENVFLYDTSLEESTNFQQRINKKPIGPVTICKSTDELVAQSDLIVFATTASTPYFNNPNVLSHNPCLLNISLRDISPDIILTSNNIVDDIEHVLNANTSPHLAFQKCQDKRFINGVFSDLIQHKNILNKNKPTIFSPMGMGILDLALGKIVYNYAVEKGLGAVIDNFFYELNR